MRFRHSEHQLYGIEPWSIWREGEAHDLSVREEFHYRVIGMYTGIVHDNH